MIGRFVHLKVREFFKKNSEKQDRLLKEFCQKKENFAQKTQPLLLAVPSDVLVMIVILVPVRGAWLVAKIFFQFLLALKRLLFS